MLCRTLSQKEESRAIAPQPPALPIHLPTTEQVFDAVGPAYETAFAGHLEQAASVRWLLAQLSALHISHARIVDVGCGTGRPVCEALARAGHDVLGIDISGAMIAAAKERVPLASFEQLDVRDFNPGAGTLDAVTVYFSLIAGLTREEIRASIARIHRFLKPGGLFVFATVPIAAECVQMSWMGKPVVVSGLAPAEAVQTIRQVGFEVMDEKISLFLPKGVEAGICKVEEIWEETHQFVYARKPMGKEMV